MKPKPINLKNNWFTEAEIDLENKNSHRGLKAKTSGDYFERLFKFQCDRENIICTRFPNGCKRVGIKQLVQVRTPFDFILTYEGKSAFIDTKSTTHLKFAHSMIEEHQVKEMIRHERAGAIAGYVIWLKPRNSIVFMNAKTLTLLAKTRGSFDDSHPNAKLIGISTAFSPNLIFSNQIEFRIG